MNEVFYPFHDCCCCLCRVAKVSPRQYAKTIDKICQKYAKFSQAMKNSYILKKNVCFCNLKKYLIDNVTKDIRIACFSIEIEFLMIIFSEYMLQIVETNNKSQSRKKG